MIQSDLLWIEMKDNMSIQDVENGNTEVHSQNMDLLFEMLSEYY